MNEKLREIIIYVAKKSEGDSHFGSVKLNKILFYSDMLAFGHLGHTITGCSYLKRPHGPSPRGIKVLKDEMEDARDIVIKEIPTLGGMQKRAVAKRDARLGSTGITESEQEMVDYMIDYFREMNGPETSLVSHDFRWWAKELGEEINMESIFLSTRELTPKEVEYGRSLETSAA
jgi:hypothetical protein